MFTNLIEIAVAVLGGGMVFAAFRQAKTKGWAGSLQMAAGGLVLLGAAAIGIVGLVVGIAFNPLKWLGAVALGIGAALFIAGQRLEGRRSLFGRRGQSAEKKAGDKAGSEPASATKPEPKAVEGRKSSSAVAGMDEDMADIEDLLRRHGIQ